MSIGYTKEGIKAIITIKAKKKSLFSLLKPKHKKNLKQLLGILVNDLDVTNVKEKHLNSLSIVITIIENLNH